MNFILGTMLNQSIYYTIHKGIFPPAIMRKYVYHFSYGRLLKPRNLTTNYFIGTNNLKPLWHQEVVLKAVRTIYNIEIIEKMIFKIFTMVMVFILW